MQCFSQLSVQIPILSALLALVFKANKIFPKIVIEKLNAKLLITLKKDDVQTSKLIMRTFACLTSSNCIVLSGSDSFFEILETLNNIVESSWCHPKNSNNIIHTNGNSNGNDDNDKEILDYHGQITAYLLATTIPWIITIFSSNSPTTSDKTESKIILLKIKNTLVRVCTDWQSPYEVGGTQAIFHIGIVHATDCSDDSDAMAGVCVCVCVCCVKYLNILFLVFSFQYFILNISLLIFYFQHSPRMRCLVCVVFDFLFSMPHDVS